MFYLTVFIIYHDLKMNHIKNKTVLKIMLGTRQWWHKLASPSELNKRENVSCCAEKAGGKIG
jgi:hypothetical protein